MRCDRSTTITRSKSGNVSWLAVSVPWASRHAHKSPNHHDNDNNNNKNKNSVVHSSQAMTSPLIIVDWLIVYNSYCKINQ